MNIDPKLSFVTVLNKLYGVPFEYQNPYEGEDGNYPAQIYVNNCVPTLMLEKISSLGLKVIYDQKIDSKTDHDIISSSCGYRGGIRKLIFTKVAALEIFEKAIREDYADYTDREKKNWPPSYSERSLAEKYNICENSGPIRREKLISIIPGLEELVTGTRYGPPYGKEGSLLLLGKTRSDLEKAGELIKIVLKEHGYDVDYGHLISVDKNDALEVLQMRYSVLVDLKDAINRIKLQEKS